MVIQTVSDEGIAPSDSYVGDILKDLKQQEEEKIIGIVTLKKHMNILCQ